MKFGKKSAGAIAAGLSLVMALSPVAAFADPEPATPATPSAKVVKTVTMNAGSTFTGEFKFKATATQLFAGTADATVATDTTGFPAINEATTGPRIWTSTTAGVDAPFTLPAKSAFPHAGVYAWTITEDTQNSTQATDENEKLTYNTANASYTLVAVVSNNSDTVTWGIYDSDPTVDELKGNKLGEADFANEYVEKTNTNDNKDNAPLKITKKVEGDQGDKTKEFNFTVTFSAPSNVPDGWTVSNITAKKGTTNLTQTAAGTFTFTAHDLDEVTFDNIVVGTTYTVAEKSYTGDGYTTEYSTVSNGQAATSTHEAVLVGEGANTATVTNTKNGTVVTGVIVNNAPFVITIAVAAAGAVAYGAAKRKLEK